VFGALGLVAEQPLGPVHPPRSDLDVAPEKHGHSETQGRDGGLARLFTMEVQSVGTFVGGKCLVNAAEPPRRVAKGLKVVGGEVVLVFD